MSCLFLKVSSEIYANDAQRYVAFDLKLCQTFISKIKTGEDQANEKVHVIKNDYIKAKLTAYQ